MVKLRDPGRHGAGNAYSLPDGWNDGQVVTVIDFDHGWVTDRDGNGRETQVFMTRIDSGWEEFTGGKWRERRV